MAFVASHWYNPSSSKSTCLIMSVFPDNSALLVASLTGAALDYSSDSILLAGSSFDASPLRVGVFDCPICLLVLWSCFWMSPVSGEFLWATAFVEEGVPVLLYAQGLDGASLCAWRRLHSPRQSPGAGSV